MAAKRKYDYEGMFLGTPFTFDKIDRKSKKIYFYDGDLYCCCSLSRFPPNMRGIKIAVNKNEAFAKEASKRHDGRYSYERSLYEGLDKSIQVTCKTHGDFKTTPHEHLTKLHGCKWCNIDSQRICNEEILNRCVEKHGLKYAYDFSEYDGSVKLSKIKITCKLHGVFQQTPYSHYSLGQGCPTCGKQTQGGKSLSDHVNASNKRDGKSFIYLIRCYNEFETFYKIGISVTGVGSRYNSSNIPYEYEVIKELKLNPETSWNVEKEILKDFKTFKYVPKIKFRGYTECFSFEKDVLHKVLNILDEERA